MNRNEQAPETVDTYSFYLAAGGKLKKLRNFEYSPEHKALYSHLTGETLRVVPLAEDPRAGSPFRFLVWSSWLSLALPLLFYFVGVWVVWSHAGLVPTILLLIYGAFGIDIAIGIWSAAEGVQRPFRALGSLAALALFAGVAAMYFLGHVDASVFSSAFLVAAARLTADAWATLEAPVLFDPEMGFCRVEIGGGNYLIMSKCKGETWTR